MSALLGTEDKYLITQAITKENSTFYYEERLEKHSFSILGI